MNNSATYFTQNQLNRYAMLCQKVAQGEITANEAYKYAKEDGNTHDSKGFKGSFKEFMNFTKEAGWMPLSPEVKPEIMEPKRPVAPSQKEEKRNYVVPVVIGLAIAGVLVYAMKKSSNSNSTAA